MISDLMMNKFLNGNYIINLLITEAMGIECENDVRQRGSFWINSKYLVWGQPLSLSEKMHSCQMFPKALYGEETLEDESLCKSYVQLYVYLKDMFG